MATVIATIQLNLARPWYRGPAGGTDRGPDATIRPRDPVPGGRGPGRRAISSSTAERRLVLQLVRCRVGSWRAVRFRTGGSPQRHSPPAQAAGAGDDPGRPRSPVPAARPSGARAQVLARGIRA